MPIQSLFSHIVIKINSIASLSTVFHTLWSIQSFQKVPKHVQYISDLVIRDFTQRETSYKVCDRLCFLDSNGKTCHSCTKCDCTKIRGNHKFQEGLSRVISKINSPYLIFSLSFSPTSSTPKHLHTPSKTYTILQHPKTFHYHHVLNTKHPRFGNTTVPFLTNTTATIIFMDTRGGRWMTWCC